MLTRRACVRPFSGSTQVLWTSALAGSIRRFSTTELSNGIKMAYELYEPPQKKDQPAGGNGPNGGPIVFVHGLFGSKRNNRSMSKYA